MSIKFEDPRVDYAALANLINAMPNAAQNFTENWVNIFKDRREAQLARDKAARAEERLGMDQLKLEADLEGKNLSHLLQRQQYEHRNALHPYDVQRAGLVNKGTGLANEQAALNLQYFPEEKELGLESQRISNAQGAYDLTDAANKAAEARREAKQAKLVRGFGPKINELLKKGTYSPADIIKGFEDEGIDRSIIAKNNPALARHIAIQDAEAEAQQAGAKKQAEKRGEQLGEFEGKLRAAGVINSSSGTDPNDMSPAAQRARAQFLDENFNNIQINVGHDQDGNPITESFMWPKEWARPPKNPQDTMNMLYGTPGGDLAGLRGYKGSIWSFLPGVSGPQGTPFKYDELNDSQKNFVDAVHAYSLAIGDVPSAVSMLNSELSKTKLARGKIDIKEATRVIQEMNAQQRQARNTPFLRAF